MACQPVWGYFIPKSTFIFTFVQFNLIFFLHTVLLNRNNFQTNWEKEEIMYQGFGGGYQQVLIYTLHTSKENLTID